MTDTARRFYRLGAGAGAVHQGFISPDPSLRDEWIRTLIGDAASVPWIAVWASDPALADDPRVAQYDPDAARLLRHAVDVLRHRLHTGCGSVFLPTVEDRMVLLVLDGRHLATPESTRLAEEVIQYGRKLGVAFAFTALEPTLELFSSDVVRAAILNPLR